MTAPFVSYAQNFEDVMLARALRSVSAGFYIDVGAQGPETDSVTKALYERGWHGINIEPVATYFEMLQRERPRDINLCKFVGGSVGEREFFEIAGSGLSTGVAEVVRGYDPKDINRRIVFQTTLDEICASNEVADVHFLKIDVEGAEAEVLQGFSLTNVRPWIVVVEATRPNTTKSAHDTWEHMLLAKNYLFAYTDGLNRYYIAKEHQELMGALSTPPNVFDNFVPVKIVQLEQNVQHHLALLAERDRTILDRDETIGARDATIKQLQSELQYWRAQFEAVITSTSWRVTEPLRRAGEYRQNLLAKLGRAKAPD